MSYYTVDEIKEYLTITDTTYDEQITLIREWTIELIERYLGRKFESAAFTQESFQPNSNLFQLDNYPIETLTSINIDGSDLTDLSDYYLDKKIGTIHGDFTNGNVYIISYTGGYTTVPAVINDALVLVVDDRYQAMLGASSAEVKDVTLFDFAKVSYDTSTSSGGSSISYSGVNSTGTLPEPLQNYLGMLDLYKSNIVQLNGCGVG